MESSKDTPHEKKGNSSRENSQTSGIPAFQPSLDSIFPSQKQIISNDQPIEISKQLTPPSAPILNELSNQEEGTEPITAAFQIASASLCPPSPEKNTSEVTDKDNAIQVR